MHLKYFAKCLANSINLVRLAIIAMCPINGIFSLLHGRGKFQMCSPLGPLFGDSGIIEAASCSVSQAWQDCSHGHAVPSLLSSPTQGDSQCSQEGFCTLVKSIYLLLFPCSQLADSHFSTFSQDYLNL